MNIGLLLVECAVDDPVEGCEASVDIDEGSVVVDGREYTFPGYPPFITELIKSGGLMNLVKEGRI